MACVVRVQGPRVPFTDTEQKMGNKMEIGHLRNTAVLTAATLLLAACGTGGNGSGVFATQQPGECNDIKGLAGPGAGSATSHAQPQRSDGAVNISTSGGMIVARKLVTIVNDFGGASVAQVGLSTPNGSVIACNRRAGGYGSKLMLEARAPTEADARRGLDSITVNHTDTLAANTLRLNTTVNFGSLSTGPGGLPVSEANNIQRLAAIVAGLPPAAAYAITPSGSNGDVRVSGLSGSTADLSASNGSVTLDGRWDNATLNTQNGIASVSGDYASLDVNASNGLVEAALQSSRNLDASFAASNGSVDVELAKSNAGFDLTANATNGQARIDVPNTVAVGPQSATSGHRQTSDYSSRAVRAQVSADSSNGNVDIHD